VNLTYEAIDSAGRSVSDLLQADSIRSGVELLRQRGLMVTHIAAASEQEVGRKQQETTVGASNVKLPLKQLVLFTRQMAMLLGSGSAVVPALEAIGKQIKKPAHKALIRQLCDDLQEGATLTESLCRCPATFGPTYCAVVAAGESSAALPETFDRLAKIVGRRRALRNKLLASLAYPVLLSGLCLSVVATLLFFVLPRFGEMFTSLAVPLPASTRFMLTVSEGVLTYWPFLAAGAGLFLGSIAYCFLHPTGRQWVADVQVKIPFIGRICAGLIQGEVFRTLGLLLEAGVSVLDSLDLARRGTSNRAFQGLFNRLEDAVTSGQSISNALEATKLIEPSVCQAVRTGEESGNLGTSMTYAANVLDEDNTEIVNTATRLLEPLIVIVMGVIVGAVAISLFMPLFDITSLMN
jgi:type II secretory pathway component PulF